MEDEEAGVMEGMREVGEEEGSRQFVHRVVWDSCRIRQRKL